MKVLHAPDYRAGNPYQRLLADAVEARTDIRVDFLSGYPRLLPLARGVRRHGADVLHLHWPEAYAGNAPRRWLSSRSACGCRRCDGTRPR